MDLPYLRGDFVHALSSMPFMRYDMESLILYTGIFKCKTVFLGFPHLLSSQLVRPLTSMNLMQNTSSDALWEQREKVDKICRTNLIRLLVNHSKND